MKHVDAKMKRTKKRHVSECSYNKTIYLFWWLYIGVCFPSTRCKNLQNHRTLDQADTASRWRRHRYSWQTYRKFPRPNVCSNRWLVDILWMFLVPLYEIKRRTLAFIVVLTWIYDIPTNINITINRSQVINSLKLLYINIILIINIEIYRLLDNHIIIYS